MTTRIRVGSSTGATYVIGNTAEGNGFVFINGTEALVAEFAHTAGKQITLGMEVIGPS